MNFKNIKSIFLTACSGIYHVLSCGDMEEISDQSLIADYLNGNDAAFAVLVQRYLRPLYNFVFRFVRDQSTTEEVVQETCVKMWRSLKKYKPNKRFSTWVFQIAKNTAFDYLRKNKPLLFSDLSDPDVEQDPIAAIPDPRPTVLQELERQAENQTAQAAVTQLPLKYQIVLELYYQHDLNFREIAEVLHEPLDTVKSRHYRSLQQLRQLLGKKPV